MVTFDTTRADHIGCYGNETIKTPNLDRLAAEGFLFRNAFSAVPITAPSHSTILTGKYPLAHGFRDNGLFVLGERQTTLAEILKASGYATAAAVGSFPLSARFGLDQGFDLYDDHFTAPYEDFRGRRVVEKSHLYFDERPAGQVNEAVLPWLEENHREPFFLWTHYFDPHHPLEPPAPYNELYLSDLYDGEIAYADERLGALLDRLGELGVLEKTLIVFTADHGEGLGEHNELTHSTLAYNSTLHVPLIVWVPGLQGGVDIQQRVGTVDIVPTILDLLGIKPSSKEQAELQGVSLRSVLESRGAPVDGLPRPQYAETLSPRLGQGLGEQRVLFDRQYKYIFGPRSELYDIQADPHETDNRIKTEPNIASAMRARLATFVAEHAATGPDTMIEVDQETRRRLEALGYIQTSIGRSGSMAIVKETLNAEGTAPQDRVADINDISTAKDLLFSNHPLEAKQVALKLVQRDPENSYYLQLEASAELLLGQLDEGLATMERIRRLDPSGLPIEPLILQSVSILYWRGEPNRALGLLLDSQSAKPSAKGQWYLADLYGAMSRREDRFQALERALQIDETFAPARVDLAVEYALAGNHQVAEEELHRALATWPYYAKGHYNLGTLKLETDDPTAALGHLARAVELDPTYLQAHYALIVTAYNLERGADAQAYLDALSTIAPDSREAKLARTLLAGNS